MKKNILILSSILFYVIVNIIRKRVKYKDKPKVIVLGLSRTGTSSISNLLSKLGYHSWHFSHNYKTLEKIFGFNAFSDLPHFRRNFKCSDIEENTKYILTTRNKSKWIKSMKLWIDKIWNIDIENKEKKQPIFNHNFNFNLFNCSFLNYLNNKVHDIKHEYPELYDDNFEDVIEKHEKNIIEIFKKNNKLNSLLVIDITKKNISSEEKIKKIIDFLEIDKYDKNLQLENLSYEKVYFKQLINLLFF